MPRAWGAAPGPHAPPPNEHRSRGDATGRPGLKLGWRGDLSQEAIAQEAIAHEAGLTVSTYARIQRGEANPTWTTVTHIARALGVSLAELGEAVDRSA